MRNYAKNQKLEIEWLDIVQHSEWIDEDKIGTEKPCLCKSVGYYFKHTADFLYISSTISDTQRDVTIIPMGCVKQVRSLR